MSSNLFPVISQKASCRNILLLLLLCAIGCQVSEELDIWPLVYYERDDEKQETQLDLLGPIYSYRDTPTETTHAFRPFFIGEFPKDKDWMQMLFLWPLGYFRQDPNDTKIWVMPFYYYRDIKRPELGERDFDWFFLPFAAFGGTDTREGSYLYLGFWGNVKGLLGYDEIKLTPFPFYVEAHEGEYVSKGYLWPLFRFGDGGGKTFRFYAFFYSYYEKEGKFRRRSYLWPIIHYNEEDLHKKHPITEFAVFPLYGQSKSDVAVSRTLLWPFFSYAYNTETGYREYNCPWPFFKYRKDKEVDELRLWPFYWYTDIDVTPVGKEQDLVVLWPIFWHSYSDYLTYEKESYYVVPFFWNHWRKGKEDGARPTTRLKIWPLLSCSTEEDGTVRYRSLSPLWFEDYLPKGIEKAWLPFFTLFDYSSGPKGAESLSLLGPLYQYQEDNTSLYHRFLIFSYKEKTDQKQDTRRFSVLGGLVEYRWDRGENELRFFYLPPLFRW